MSAEMFEVTATMQDGTLRRFTCRSEAQRDIIVMALAKRGHVSMCRTLEVGRGQRLSVVKRGPGR